MDSSDIESRAARRREELYGPNREEHVRSLRSKLKTDHIKLISEEGMKNELPPWQSTHELNFQGTQPEKAPPLQWNSGMQKQKVWQNDSHFEMRGDAAPVNNAIYQASLTRFDYSGRQGEQLPPVKPDGKINLPDMNPRYWRDKTMGESFYATDFSDVKAVTKDVELPTVRQERNDMRRRNVKDVRTTHFQLGNDPSNFQSETVSSYYTERSPKPIGSQRNRDEDFDAAALTKRMLQQERDSAIFRAGDYNVTAAKPQISTFTRDYDARQKPDKAAAFEEPTQTRKGRFLQDSPVKKAVQKEACSYPGPPPNDTDLKHTYTNSSALRQAFMQHDPTMSGCVSKDVLRRVNEGLVDPISPLELEEILMHTVRGKDSTINYDSFVETYDAFIKRKLENQRLHTPVDENGNDVVDTSKPSTAAPGQPTLENAILGKEYQTVAHFSFGNDADKIASIYNKDYEVSKVRKTTKPEAKAAPVSSEVMHKLPGVGFGASTKQTDFIDYREVGGNTFFDMMDARNAASLKNKRRHDINSVYLTGDKEKDAADRQKSLSHESFILHSELHRPQALSAPVSKYRYLDSDGALEYPPNIPSASETQEAFSAADTLPGESAETLSRFKSENTERGKDGKKAHFEFGNDMPSHTSEMMANFSEKNPKDTNYPAAGKKNQIDPRFPHTEVSKNTQDLNRDPMAPSTFEALRLAKKSYYNAAPNPIDPLHINLRSRLMDLDTEKTGKIDRRILRDTCKDFQIDVSAYAFNKLLERCVSDFDDRIDYHKLIRSLTVEQIPDNVSAAHSSSVMMHDYRPLKQRGFTNAQLVTMTCMDKKPILPAPTHFFHMDGSGENQLLSMTQQDFIKPELC